MNITKKNPLLKKTLPIELMREHVKMRKHTFPPFPCKMGCLVLLMSASAL